MWQFPTAFTFYVHAGSEQQYHVFAPGANTRFIEAKPGMGVGLVSVNKSTASRTIPSYRLMFSVKTQKFSEADYSNTSIDSTLTECVFFYPAFCGDGVLDTTKGEQCDDGNQNNNDSCSNTCQPPVAPVCVNLAITPTSVTNGGTITYTCTATNATSYSVVLKRADGTTVQSFTSATGTFTIPATPGATYTAACYINGQTTTPAACQKTITNNVVSEAVCTGLTVTPTSLTNGGTVSYTCTGNNVTSYSVVFTKPDGTNLQSFTTPTGTVTIPATPTGTYNAKCFINGQTTTPAICTKSITNINPTQPNIQVIKDDNDNHDDFQEILPGGPTHFTIVVRNPGPEPLENVVLNDPLAPECNRSAAQTLAMIVNVGNRDQKLDPGETFSYVCSRYNVDQSTFPNNENRVCVSGRGIPSGITVNSCDITRIGFKAPPAICQNMTVSQNGNQTNVQCTPGGGYKLFVLKGQQVTNTLQSPTGFFSLSLGDGTYKLVCLRDGETSVQPNCQKTITINPEVNYCVLESSTNYGGAPLRSQLKCTSPIFAPCSIQVLKDGQPWRNITSCQADLIFDQKGTYDATCYIGNLDTQHCKTRILVDVMTKIPTGPFLPVILLISVGLAGYIVYRRRKTV